MSDQTKVEQVYHLPNHDATGTLCGRYMGRGVLIAESREVATCWTCRDMARSICSFSAGVGLEKFIDVVKTKGR